MGERGKEKQCNGYGVIFGDDKNIFELDMSDS